MGDKYDILMDGTEVFSVSTKVLISYSLQILHGMCECSRVKVELKV